jgi:site-specific DNA recombinase
MSEKVKRSRCYIYTRVSTAAQTEGFSLEAQLERLRGFAAFRELEIAGEYCDAGKSGKSIKGRPAFRQMMEDILSQKDGIRFVLVFKLSRFGRNAADILKSMQLLTDFGVDLVCVEDAIDSSTQGGRLTLAILSAVAEIEKENITAQFLAGKMQKIRDGRWYGGPAPYGYRNVEQELVQDPYEARVVWKIFDLYLQEDMRVTSVAGYLNDNGILRRKNEEGDSDGQEPFTYGFISRILDNPVYCGKLVYGRRTNRKDRSGCIIKPDPEQRITVEGTHEPIITVEEWEQVQEKRRKNSNWGKKVIEPERIGLLSGLIKCPLCGAGMVARSRRQVNKNHGGYYKTSHYYLCRNYRKEEGRTCSFPHTFRQEKIDDAVFEIVNSLCGRPEFCEAVSHSFRDHGAEEKIQAELERSRKELRNDELEVRKLGERMDSLDILEDGYEEEYDRIQSCMDLYYDRIEETERRIAGIYDQMRMAAENLRTADEIEKMLSHFSILYQKMTYQERREMYRLFIDHIEILPKAGHDGKILKSISFRFPGQFGESPQADRKEVAGKELCFTLDCTNLKLSAERTKATYAELKRYILDNYGLKVSSLYIAQIKRKYGLEVGEQYHKPADPDKKVPVCPPAKEDAIKEALIHFKML